MAILKSLVIEDDAETALHVTEGLREIGHIVFWASTGSDGFLQALQGEFALIVVDRMLPGLDGLTLVRRLRARTIDTPILFLTALDDLNARIEGLEGGGDDYLTKPFALGELIARVNALTRRAQRQAAGGQTRYRAGGIDLDLVTRKVSCGGEPIALKPQEFKLLEFLMQNSGRVVTRTMLLENVWGLDFDPGTTVIESHISRLRSKLDRVEDPIHTVRGTGYVFRAP